MIDQDVNDIFEFEKNIAKYHWTNDEQRARFNETVRTTVGNLSFTFNTTFDFTDYVRRCYLLGNVTLQDTDIVAVSEVENALKILEINVKKSFQLLRKPVDKNGWGDYSAPSVVNAFYEPSKNQISFPAGILQTPFFNKDAPKYLNYGGKH
ncbi:unnamed protein product [Rotaria sordida]|uniref:Peptidase M13 C-terminal domain-containing protein n=1 Tax=Rotaria sordida TaxID=392033 RepID=A0A814I4R1_9BILA|nr:unnamed protein product [Rotaria sordida]CAF1020463.1 unnamed protein product [Rotaria sordida]